jgi:hypothetical protein
MSHHQNIFSLCESVIPKRFIRDIQTHHKLAVTDEVACVVVLHPEALLVVFLHRLDGGSASCCQFGIVFKFVSKIVRAVVSVGAVSCFVRDDQNVIKVSTEGLDDLQDACLAPLEDFLGLELVDVAVVVRLLIRDSESEINETRVLPRILLAPVLSLLTAKFARDMRANSRKFQINPLSSLCALINENILGKCFRIR